MRFAVTGKINVPSIAMIIPYWVYCQQEIKNIFLTPSPAYGGRVGVGGDEFYVVVK